MMRYKAWDDILSMLLLSRIGGLDGKIYGIKRLIYINFLMIKNEHMERKQRLRCRGRLESEVGVKSWIQRC